VTAVEPSPVPCRNMEAFFQRLGLKNTIVSGTAETMDQLTKKFDFVIFWSSLHHCDNPITALKNTYNLLRPGGKVLLFEPVLRFYRTKKCFYRMMIENPTKVGHYGGNEHIYRYQEYPEFLRVARFHHVSTIPSTRYSMTPKRAVWDGNVRWLIKKLYYRFTRHLTTKNPSFSRFLINFSLLLPLIVGEKTS